MITKQAFDLLALPYNVATYIYQDAQSVQWPRYLNGFVIKNTGTTNLTFNNDEILPQQSKSVGGNYGEIYKGRLEIRFATPLPPLGFINEVTITQKFYLFPE